MTLTEVYNQNRPYYTEIEFVYIFLYVHRQDEPFLFCVI